MEKGRVSIIVPIYNSQNTLEKCIKSLINQTYRNIEIILVNDGSKDNSIKIINDFLKQDNRIILINQENNGVSASRNIGIRVANGEFIAFVDSDDYVDEIFIEKTIEIFNKTSCDVVRNNFRKVYEDGKIMEDKLNCEEFFNKKQEISKIKDKLIKNIITGNIQSYSWLLMIKKDLITKNELYFDEEVAFMEDLIYFLNLINKIESIYFIKDPHYYYYQNNKSVTKNSSNYIKNMDNLLIAYKKIEKIFTKEYNNEEYIRIANMIYINGEISYLKSLVVNNKEYKEVLKKLR